MYPNMEGQEGQAGARKFPRSCQLPGPPLAALGWEDDTVQRRKQGFCQSPSGLGPRQHPAKKGLSSCQLSP